MRRSKIKNGLIATLVMAMIVLVATNLAHANGPWISLPTQEVSLRVEYPSTCCYYTVVLGDVPSGHHVTNGEYLGWCVDENHYIYSGKTYKAKMYSSYDLGNPQLDPDWDNVNHILNHKQGTKDDVQAAIWYFVDGGRMPTTNEGQAMVNDAKMYGEDFIPAPGQVLAVVLWVDSNTQVPIIELVVPLQNVVPEYPLGPILGVTTFLAALGVFKYKRSKLTVVTVY